MKPKLLFSNNAIPLVLEAFGKKIDSSGTIVESSTNEPILTSDGETIKSWEFGGIHPKLGFLKNDLYSISKLGAH